MKKIKKGKFIVIDGTDGSGKATQVKLLVKRLRAEGKKIKAIDFPQYYNNFFGKFIGECLAGKYGDFLALDPYFASIPYAIDRFESSPKIKRWLEDGYIVIGDRYASANQIHQGSKIQDLTQRKFFLDWLEKMEFLVLKIPKPNMIIYLDVPVEKTRELLMQKQAAAKKRYLKGAKDAAENNVEHLLKSQASALDLVKIYNNWIKIECYKKGVLLSREEINELIWQKIKDII